MLCLDQIHSMYKHSDNKDTMSTLSPTQCSRMLQRHTKVPPPFTLPLLCCVLVVSREVISYYCVYKNKCYVLSWTREINDLITPAFLLLSFLMSLLYSAHWSSSSQSQFLLKCIACNNASCTNLFSSYTHYHWHMPVIHKLFVSSKLQFVT